MEKMILDLLAWLQDIDFNTIFKILGIGFSIFWVVIIGWVIADASERISRVWLRILVILVVVVLPLFGLLIYLVVRPRVTTSDENMLDLEQRYLRFEAAGLTDCPMCGYELMPNFVFCPRCGKELRVKCSSCEIYLEPNWSTCPFCGARQEQSRSVRPGAITRAGGDIPVVDTSDVKKIEEEVEVSDEIEKVEAELKKVTVKEQKKAQSKGRKGRSILEEADGFVRYVGKLPMKFVAGRGKRKDTVKPPVAASTEENGSSEDK